MIFAFLVTAAAGMGLVLFATARPEPRRVPVRVHDRDPRQHPR